HRALSEAGFDAVLVKPLEASALRTALAAALAGKRTPRIAEAGPETVQGPAPGIDLPAWDDDAALRALNGERTHVEALRQLFIAELPAARDRVLACAREGDHGALRDTLHRLRASCGF